MRKFLLLFAIVAFLIGVGHFRGARYPAQSFGVAEAQCTNGTTLVYDTVGGRLTTSCKPGGLTLGCSLPVGAPANSACVAGKFYAGAGTDVPGIDSLDGSKSWNFPDAPSYPAVVVTTASTQTLLSKIFDSASNTLKLAGTTVTGIQGNTGVVQTAGSVSGTAAACYDASGNITNVGCPATAQPALVYNYAAWKTPLTGAAIDVSPGYGANGSGLGNDNLGVAVPIPQNCTLKNLQVAMVDGSTITAAKSIQVTVLTSPALGSQTNSTTSITCNIAPTQTSCTDLVNTAAATTGMKTALRFLSTDTTTNHTFAASYICQ